MEPQVAEKPYLIYDFVQEGVEVDPYVVPWEIDFSKALSIRLHPKRTFILGELSHVEWYADYDGTSYELCVLREEFSYDRDPISGLANSRTQTIIWMDEDGNDGEFPKTRGPKYYSSLNEKINEISRKRSNQIGKAAEVLIGALFYSGLTMEQAIATGQNYWKSLVSEITLFKEGNVDELKNRLNNDTDPSWVPLVKVPVLDELA